MSSDDTIEYNFTVEDKSCGSAVVGRGRDEEDVGPLFEHACHEGNYGLYNTLVGARLEEKKAAEAAAKKDSK